MQHNRKKAQAKQGKSKRTLTIPIQKSDHEANVLYRALNTPESNKLIKKEKKLPIENIFIKTKSKK
jgi:hypothetical protein